MTKKLLNKTTRIFLMFSVMILLISAPVFYTISHWLYVYEADEILFFHKGAFVKNHQAEFTETDVAFWNKYNNDSKFVTDIQIEKDSLFSKMYFDSIANEEEPFRELWSPMEINGKRYTYIERINLVEMEGTVLSVALMFLFIIIVFLIGIIWISKRSSAKIWKPFYKTLYQIQNFEIDQNKKPTFETSEIEEFNQLNASVEKLIEKNIAIYKNQKEFIENAAHELQTPLALFQTKVDTLSQSTTISESESQLLESLNNDIARLNRLNKNLLLLSKIENDNYIEKQPIEILTLINKNLDFFIEQAHAKDLIIETHFKENLSIESNPILFEILINNLFLNSIKHNVKGGKIHITVKQNSISFSNSGLNNSLKMDQLFKRFSKTNPSSKGNGLGLSIIKKIVELNNWEIDYSYKKNLHTFKVRF